MTPNSLLNEMAYLIWFKYMHNRVNISYWGLTRIQDSEPEVLLSDGHTMPWFTLCR